MGKTNKLALVIKRFFLFILFVLGVCLIVFGVFWWFKSGMPLERLMPGRENFGAHPLHLSILSMAMVTYVVFEYLRRD